MRYIDAIDRLERVQAHLEALSYIEAEMNYTGNNDISIVKDFISDILMNESEAVKNALNTIRNEAESKRSIEK